MTGSRQTIRQVFIRVIESQMMHIIILLLLSGLVWLAFILYAETIQRGDILSGITLHAHATADYSGSGDLAIPGIGAGIIDDLMRDINAQSGRENADLGNSSSTQFMDELPRIMGNLQIPIPTSTPGEGTQIATATNRFVSPTSTSKSNLSPTNTGIALSAGTPTRTYTSTPTRTLFFFIASSTPTRISLYNPTNTPVRTATRTPTKTISIYTPTRTPTRTVTPTATRTATASATATRTKTSTPTGSFTVTATDKATLTSTSTASATATASATGVQTLPATTTRTATLTSTSTSSPTATPTSTSTETPTSTPTTTTTPVSLSSPTPGIPPTPVSYSLHLADMDAWSEFIDGDTYFALARVSVHDGNHKPLMGVRVIGVWSNANGEPIPGISSCITNSLGSCELKASAQPISMPFVRYRLLPPGLALYGYTYLIIDNHDPDGCETSTCDSLTVYAPTSILLFQRTYLSQLISPPSFWLCAYGKGGYNNSPIWSEELLCKLPVF